MAFLRHLGEYRGLDSEVYGLILFNVIFSFSMGFSDPSFAPFIASLNVSMTLFGKLNTGSEGVCTFIRPIAGWLIDRYDRRRFMLVGGLLAVLGYILYTLTNSWVLLALGIFLTSMNWVFRAVTVSAAIGDHSTAESRGKAFSFDVSARAGARAVSPLIGGLLSERLALSFQATFGVTVLLMVGALVFILATYSPKPLPKVDRPRITFRGFWREISSFDRNLIPFLVIAGVDSFSWMIAGPFYFLFIFQELSATKAQLGIVMAISASTPAISSFLLGPALDKVGRKVFLAVSELMALGAFLPLILGRTVGVAYISAVFWGLVYSLWMPAYSAYVADVVGSERFAQATGTMGFVTGITSALSPAIGGWLYDNGHPESPLAVTMVLALIIAFLIATLLGRGDRSRVD